MYSGNTEYKLRTSENRVIKSIANRYSMGRDFLYQNLATFISFLFKLITPFRLLSMIYPKLKFTAKMPYGPKVLMEINSFRELRRAGFVYREPDTIDWVERCAKEGGVFYDVGANVGAVSLVYAANVLKNFGSLPDKSILSFEPSLSTFTRLCENIKQNDWLKAIIPFSTPLSNKQSMETIVLSTFEAGGSGHQVAGDQSETETSMELPVMTLTIDQLHYDYNFPAPKWLKIDVDGIDYQILKGAERVIKDGFVKKIQIERNGDEDNIRNFLKQYSFSEEELSIEGSDINLRFYR